MEIQKATRLEVAYFVWRQRPPAASLTVVVKGTFDLVPGSVCTLAQAQALPQPEELNEGDADALSVRYDSDFAFFKPRGECFLAGTAHAPKERSVQALRVGFRIGSIERSIAVIGDREWKRGLLGRQASDPLPFASMPLRLERCFGGPGYDPNPLGIGFAQRGERWALPNLEDPNALVDSTRSRPNPASAFPTPSTFESRIARAGSYDADWLKTRWPDLPRNFDFAYFNAAPAEQQIEGYFQGDEPIRLDHLSPEHPSIESRLPGMKPRCFFELRTAEVREVALALDTITVDADLLRIFLVWRGVTDAPDEKLEGVLRLDVVDDNRAEPKPAAHHLSRLEAARDRAAAEEAIVPEAPPQGAAAAARAQAPAEEAIVPEAPPPGAAAAARVQGPAADPAVKSEVAARIARGESLARRDLSGADLGGALLDGVDLSFAILAGVSLKGASLKGAKLAGASLPGADLTGANFAGASLAGADLTGAAGEESSFEGANLDGATIEKSRLGRAIFRKSSCRKADFTGADLRGADFSEAALDEADFARSLLDQSVFAGAVLTDATVEGASGPDAVFSRAEIVRFRASGGRFLGAAFEGVKAEGSIWRGATLERARFSGANLGRADFSNAKLEGAIFDGAELGGSRFVEAKLEGASFAGANLFEASLESADLTSASFEWASCFSAELRNAKLPGARFDGADLGRTKLEGRG